MAALECFVIADDLTGACDAAVHFAMRGRPTVVPIAGVPGKPSPDVVAISTESRDLEPAALPQLIAAAAASLDTAPRMVFKKIDSTLRGHAGVEIAAALEAFRCDVAVVCPAFPRMNRIVEAGCLRVAGATDFVPIDVAAYLCAQGVEDCMHVQPGAVAGAIASGARTVVLDAVCDADLDRIVAAARAIDRRILWAGSAGLASALARTFPAKCCRHEPARRGPVLFCIGSDHRVTIAQQTALVNQRQALLVQPELAEAEWIRGALGQDRPVVLRIPRRHVSAEWLREQIAGAPAAAVVLSGGDTASLFCRAAGVGRIDLLDEILPGIPRGVIRGGDFDGVSVATKSGGFGDADALIQVADYYTCLT